MYTMYYTSVINIRTTPSSELVLFWLLCVSVVLMISPGSHYICSYMCSYHYHKNGAFDWYRCVYWSHILHYLLDHSHIHHIDHQPYDYIHFHCIDNQLHDHIHIYHIGYQFDHIHFHHIDYQPDSHIHIYFIDYQYDHILFHHTDYQPDDHTSTISCQIRVVWFGKHRRIFVLFR